MAEARSIYDVIRDELRLNGGSEVSLPERESNNSLMYADGAMDGIMFFHGSSKPGAQDKRLMARAVKLASGYKVPEADEAFWKLGESYRAICMIDELQKYILAHQKSLNAGNLYGTGYSLMAGSGNLECVKYGMSIIELFEHDSDTPEEVKEVVRSLAMCNEFTVFAVWIMRKWENGNDEIFRVIQKVRGWGRIHALEMLSPDTPEIREWILLNGVDNDIMPMYSAYTAWEKADVDDYLKGPLTAEELEGISDIIDGLLDEGPLPGISQLDDPEASLLQYLSRTKEFELNVNEYDTILQIREWAEEYEAEDIATISEKILQSEACRKTAAEAVKSGKGIRLAEALGIDFSEDLFRHISGNFDKDYHLCRYLIEDEESLKRFIDLYREKLPLQEMRADPRDELGLSAEFDNYQKLDMFLPYLSDAPGMAEDLVTAGLWSPVTRTRNIAAGVLADWTWECRRPLQKISAGLYKEVCALRKKEVVDSLIELLDRLIVGEIIEPEEDEYDYDDFE